jgi:cytochrome oxidase assembly protein ShyY1
VRFLLTRRWVLFGLGVVLLALLCIRLGQWQFHRLHDTEQSNAWIRTNLKAAPVPVGDVLAVDHGVPDNRVWTPVRATGTYDASATIVLRYQARDGRSGVDLVTPLVTDSGAALIVDRGWMATPNTGAMPADPPAPPAGRVTVSGYVQGDNPPIDATVVTDHSTRAISTQMIARSLGHPVYQGYVAATSETPPPARPLVPVQHPDLSNGPHLFYGIQWWFFSALAVFGFCYLVWDEMRKKPAAEGKESRTTAAHL